MKNLKKVLLTGTITAIAIFAMTITAKATTVTVTGDVLNIRKSASTDAAVIAMISKGVECELIEEQGDWYKIKYKNYTGYISKQYAKIEGENSNNNENPNTISTNENTQINNETNTQTNNETNTQTNNEANNQTNNNESTPNKSNQESIKLVYKKLKQNSDIKILPLIHASNISTAKKNTEILVLSEITGWTYIQTDEVNGWVRTEILEDSRVVSSNNDSASKNEDNQPSDGLENEKESIGYINEDYVNMRKGAGTSYKIVKVLTLNLKVTIIGEDGDWYQIKSGNDTGYILKQFISDSKKVTSRSLTTERTENKTEEKTETKVEDNKTTDKTNNSTSNAQSSIKGTDVVAYARKFLGHKYVYGGNGSDGTFDCSGFTMYVYKHFGISLPHGATSQYNSGKGTKITKQSDLKVGDIVLLTDYETGKGIGHCGIYLGNGDFIHASTTTYTVTISSLNTMYKGRFYAGLRLI